jgi:hypothetical protein
MSMSTAMQRLFSPAFLQEALAQEVHRLLSLQYARGILQALDEHPEGLEGRYFDVKVVGLDGSGRSAYVVLKKLQAAGWITVKSGSKPKLWMVTPKGREALELDHRSDSIGSGGVGVG